MTGTGLQQLVGKKQSMNNNGAIQPQAFNIGTITPGEIGNGQPAEKAWKRKKGLAGMFERPFEKGGIFSWGLFGQNGPLNNEFAKGKPGSFKTLPTKTPQQSEYMNNLLTQSQKNLNNPYKGFEPLEQQAQRNFATQTIPSLAERFTAMGGGQRNSAFQGALGSAASELNTNLAALKSQYGMANRQQSLAEGKTGLSPQFQIYHEMAKKGLLDPEVASDLFLKILPLLAAA